MSVASKPADPSAAVEQKASGSSFYSAMRLMPKAERQAMFAIYAFCRLVDDIADDGIGTRDERHRELAAWRADLDVLYANGPAERAGFLSDPVQRYGLRKEDFLAIIDGMEMDVVEDIIGPSLETLDLYCERVASAVGRLSVKVFGMEDEPGFLLAHHLGRALQLTNILRDLDEDAGMGRLYLPRELLEAHGVASHDPHAAISNPKIDGTCRDVAALSHEHYRKAEDTLRARPRGRIRTPRLMGAVYREILRRMEATGWAPPRIRVSIPRSQLLLLVLRNGLA